MTPLSSPVKTFISRLPVNYHSATSPGDLLHFLHLSATRQSPSLSRQCHVQILSLGLTQNPFLASKLISAYAICGAPIAAQLVFDSLRCKSVFLYNSLISGYVKNFAFREAFRRFNCMSSCCVVPDDFTLATVSKACGDARDLMAGRAVHGRSVRTGFVSDVVVSNSIMSMYSKCGESGECLKVFEEMPVRSSGSWNVVFAGFVDSGKRGIDEEVVGLVRGMQSEGLRPDSFTVSSLLCLCGGGNAISEYGRELHGFIVRHEPMMGFFSDLHLGCCLIDMYSRNGMASASRRIFDQMSNRNVFAWTAMVTGYVHNGYRDEALKLFREMQTRDQVEPNMVSLVSVLPACSSIGGFTGGKQVHGYAIRKEMNHALSLANALIDMYCKCGSLKYARNVFRDSSFFRDSISWSSMISGYGLHGMGDEAVGLYNQMLQSENKTDAIAVLGVLTACSRSGLINEGFNIYYSATTQYGIKPTAEICACIVDMLGRSGQLAQALNFVGKMPMKPGPSVWGALLSAAILHGNPEMQDLAYDNLTKLEPQSTSSYISLSNMYASSRKWNAVVEVRTAMKELGLQKTPGCSWITVGNSTHSFYVADKLHPCCQYIYELVDGLIELMKETFDPHEYEGIS